MTNKFQIDVLYIDDNNYKSAQAVFPGKIIVPKCVVDEIRRECAEKAIIFTSRFGCDIHYFDDDGNDLDSYKEDLTDYIIGKEGGKE